MKNGDGPIHRSTRRVPGLSWIAFAALALGSLAALSAPQEATAQDPGPVTDADLRQLNRVSGLALSPDGRRVAFAQGGGIWVLETAAGNSPRRVADGMTPTWSPSGGALAFYARSEASGELQVFTADLATGNVTQVTSVEGGAVPDRIAWSRDDVLAFIVSRPRDASVVSADRSAPAPASAEEGFPLILGADAPDGHAFAGILAGMAPPARPTPTTTELFVHDLTSGEAVQLTSDAAGYHSPSWSPDGRTIAVVSREEFRGGAFVSAVYLIDGATGERHELAPGVPGKAMPRWSPDGSRLAFAAYSRTDHAESGVRVVEIDAAGRTGRGTDAYSGSVLDIAWARDGRSLYITRTIGVTQPVQRLDLATGATATVGSADYVARGGSLTVSGSGAVAWVESRGDVPSVVSLLRAGTDRAAEIYDPNPQLRDVELGRQEVVSWRNRRGDAREGILILPVGYEPGRRYPLIVSAYSEGSHLNSFQGDAAPAFGNQRHAARGYAVFFPGPRVPWMYGGAVGTDNVTGPPGWDLTVDDVESGVDVLIERGIVDPDRMAIMGFSNGGAATVGLITRTDRYRAAVAVAPANLNWVEAALRQDNMGGRWIRTQRFMGIDEDILEDPLPYLEGSPVFALASVDTPLLLAVGDRDDASFTVPTIETYLALRRLGKDVTLLRYADMAHGFFGPAGDDLNGRITDFLDRHLEPGR